MASDQTLLLVPGAGHHHEDAWWEALRHGVNREKRKAASKLDGVARRMFDYEGWERPQDLDAATEIADQREALARLQQLSERKHFRRRGYDALPGKSALREFAYDLAAPMAGAVGLGGWVAGRMVPELVRLGVDGSSSQRFVDTLNECVLHAPSFTLRGGTREILKGVIARGLGLR